MVLKALLVHSFLHRVRFCEAGCRKAGLAWTKKSSKSNWNMKHLSTGLQVPEKIYHDTVDDGKIQQTHQLRLVTGHLSLRCPFSDQQQHVCLIWSMMIFWNKKHTGKLCDHYFLLDSDVIVCHSPLASPSSVSCVFFHCVNWLCLWIHFGIACSFALCKSCDRRRYWQCWVGEVWVSFFNRPATFYIERQTRPGIQKALWCCGQFCFGKSPHRHIQEIAAEAAEGKEVAKSSPSCSLFVCASEQSACVRNASGICGLKRVPSSYRSATQKVYRNPVDCRPPAKWRKNLRSSAKRSSCGVAPSRMLPWFRWKHAFCATMLHSNVRTCWWISLMAMGGFSLLHRCLFMTVLRGSCCVFIMTLAMGFQAPVWRE